MKNCNDEFLDLLGLSVETEDTWLNRKLNNHLCYKGGSGPGFGLDLTQPYRPSPGGRPPSGGLGNTGSGTGMDLQLAQPGATAQPAVQPQPPVNNIPGRLGGILGGLFGLSPSSPMNIGMSLNKGGK